MSDFNRITGFTADRFVPATRQDAKKKARFARTFIRVVETNFPRGQFTKAFYRRLSRSLGTSHTTTCSASTNQFGRA
jgi:hypothetical protein